MKALRTVNMIWERRYRGTYPVARFGLADDGTVVLAVPRPLEARAYDLTHLRPDGSAEVRAGFSVETLLKLEATPYADDFLGMTADDIYLFRAGSKSRFLGERRISYVDAALSADGQRLAVGFSDIAGASYMLAYGEIGGRVLWTRDMDSALSAVTISRDGRQIVAGAEDGTIWRMDAAMQDIWRFMQEEAVRALACSADGSAVAYGTAGGAVGLIDAEGARRWEVRVTGEIAALALSGEGTLCAVLCCPAEGGGTPRLLCLVGEGQVGWEYAAEKRLVGLSVSANGLYLAASARDGTLAVYEVVPGEAQGVVGGAGLPGATALARSGEQAEAGDLEGAVRTLRAALEANPADCALCEALIARRQEWLSAVLAAAEAQMEAGDLDAAVAALESALRLEPQESSVVSRLEAARLRRAERLLETARSHEAAGEGEAAEAALLQAIADAPLRVEARRELGALRQERAQEAAAEAERLLAEGDLEGGVAALERAQSLAPTPEIDEKLARAQVAHEFMQGIAFYNQKRYHEAVFQFKKVLARDPEHGEARRYLGYAQKFAQDTLTGDLTDRFSRLE